MVSDEELKQVKVTTRNKNRLDSLGLKGDSYNDIIGWLLDKYSQDVRADKNKRIMLSSCGYDVQSLKAVMNDA